MQEMDGMSLRHMITFQYSQSIDVIFSTLNGERNARMASHLNRFPEESLQPFCQSLLDLEEKWQYLVSPLFFTGEETKASAEVLLFSPGVFDVEANDTRCINAVS